MMEAFPCPQVLSGHNEMANFTTFFEVRVKPSMYVCVCLYVCVCIYVVNLIHPVIKIPSSSDNVFRNQAMYIVAK
jgi:hypothetical protein